eukprot:3604468-Rhodomonas_salina.3
MVCHAMPGTDTGYLPTHALCHVRYQDRVCCYQVVGGISKLLSAFIRDQVTCAICLRHIRCPLRRLHYLIRARYAMPGTDLDKRCAMSGTDAGTRYAVSGTDVGTPCAEARRRDHARRPRVGPRCAAIYGGSFAICRGDAAMHGRDAARNSSNCGAAAISGSKTAVCSSNAAPLVGLGWRQQCCLWLPCRHCSRDPAFWGAKSWHLIGFETVQVSPCQRVSSRVVMPPLAMAVGGEDGLRCLLSYAFATRCPVPA